MEPCPRSLLVLGLCLVQTIHMQEGLLPKPSIRARPGPLILRGRPVTIVCWGPAGADLFRLVEGKNTSVYWDQKITFRHGSQRAEARFPIDAVSDVTARSYFCQYIKGPIWSNQSETLELKVAGTTLEVTSPPTGAISQRNPASQSCTVENCVRIGLAGVVLLILVAILAEAGHSQHRLPHATGMDTRDLLTEKLDFVPLGGPPLGPETHNVAQETQSHASCICPLGLK